MMNVLGGNNAIYTSFRDGEIASKLPHDSDKLSDEHSSHKSDITPIEDAPTRDEHEYDMLNDRGSFRMGSMMLGEHGPMNPAGVFLDVAAMKDRVRDALKKPTYNVHEFYSEFGVWPRIAKSVFFEYITLGVIAFNALWIAVDTDANDAEILLHAHVIFQLAENAFCAFFSFELTARFMAFKRKRSCLHDSWFVFDGVLVVMMVVETWVMSAIMIFSNSGGGSGLGNASILRIARLLRLSRMARMVRLLRVMPELMIMIKGMMAAVRSVFFTLLLQTIIMYIFAIAFTQLLVETEIGKRYYHSVPESMYTLLIYGTLLDEIGNLTREMGEESIFITGLFMIFVLLSALTVMNMLIGVLCEVVSAVAATEKEEMLVNWVKTKIEQIFQQVDADGSYTVTRKEFVSILENTVACRALQDVGVDVVGLVDFADAIFEDEGMGEKELTFSEFMDVVLQLRGCNNATVKDIVDLRKLVQKVGSQTNTTLIQMKRLSHVLHGAVRASSHEDRFSLRKNTAHGERSMVTLDTSSSKFRPKGSDFPIRSAKNGISVQHTLGKASGTAFVPEDEGHPPKVPEFSDPVFALDFLSMEPLHIATSELWEPILDGHPAQCTSNGLISVAPTVHSADKVTSLESGLKIISSGSIFNGRDYEHEVNKWQRIGNGDIEMQLERLDDALRQLASIREGIVGCVPAFCRLGCERSAEAVL